MNTQQAVPGTGEGVKEYDESSRREMWRVVGKILTNTTHLDLHLYDSLPSLIWSSFQNFHEYYQRLLTEEKLRNLLPTHLLARPLIGFQHKHDEQSPLLSGYRGEQHLQPIKQQVHFFLMYVGLSNRLREVSGGREGAISRRLLQTPDPKHFCYVFRREEGSGVNIGSGEGIRETPLCKQGRFSRELAERKVNWPSINITDLRDLHDISNDYEARYTGACRALDGSIFDLLEGEDVSEALVSWWVHEARADFVLFRGLDEGKRVDTKYTWGGVWFLFDTNSVIVGEHLRALYFLVRECFNIAAIEMRAREGSREQERANIGAGMFHNLAHYVLPLSVYGRAIGRYVEDGDEQAVLALANNIEDTVNRLARFVAAVQIYVKQRDAYLHPKIDSLESVPADALLIHTRALYTSLCWFSNDVGAGIGRKYLTILCNLCSEDKEFDPDNFDHLKELQKRVKHLVHAKPPPGPDFDLLTLWWKEHFGVNIKAVGDFATLKGHQALVSGVIEEFILNSLCAASSVIAGLKLRGDARGVLRQTHISIEAAGGAGRRPAIYLKNWSACPLDEKVFDEPEQDKGWGIFGNRLLMKRAGGDITIVEDGKWQQQRGEWPLWVGFMIALVK